MSAQEKSQLEVVVHQDLDRRLPNDLVMAWAVDATTQRPRYILELDPAHSGAKCNCICPSCKLPLIAVNAGKTVWQRRPHFRHPEGAAREDCVVIAARKAIEAMLGQQEHIVLPRRRRSREVEGLSGTYYNAWVERQAETVGVSQCAFADEANAVLTLDDGRRIHVRLVGRGETSHEIGGFDEIAACIEIQADDPSVANMAPEDVLARLELVWDEGCWVRHWADSELDSEADALAVAKAVDAIDWLDAGDLPDDLSPAERRETLLHREVKAILERERRIRIPELKVEVVRRRASGFVDKQSWSSPDVELQLSAVELEVHLGNSVPDVVASWIEQDGWSRSMLVEVTVTNRITDERVERLSSFGWPVLEIDISRMGGSVTRDELTRLVVGEVAGKRWLYHPTLSEEKARLIADMRQEEMRIVAVERQKQAILAVPVAEWASRFLEAFRRRWQEQMRFGQATPIGGSWRQAEREVTEAIEALIAHGYPASLLAEHPLRTVIARILSLCDGHAVEYRTDVWGVINAILCDGPSAKKWHTLYLIALKTWPPAISESQQEKIKAWRRNVVESIWREETAYVRETTCDRLIGLLFPEMRLDLAKPFGTLLYIPKHDEVLLDTPSQHSQPQQAANNEKGAMFQAAGIAAGQGHSPASFASDYARKVGGRSANQILERLIESGLARNQWDWS